MLEQPLAPRDQEVLDTILKKDPDNLSYNERAILRARRDYLKKTELEEFAEVLDMEEEEEVVSEPQVLQPDHLKTPEQTDEGMDYENLLDKARAIDPDVKIKRLKRGQLIQYIKAETPEARATLIEKFEAKKAKK